jgi:hypothetical protein
LSAREHGEHRLSLLGGIAQEGSHGRAKLLRIAVQERGVNELILAARGGRGDSGHGGERGYCSS